MAEAQSIAGASAGNHLAILEAVAIDVRAMRLEGDLARIRAHVNDGDPATRRHARDWLRQLEAERLVLCRWRSELAAPAMLWSGEASS